MSYSADPAPASKSPVVQIVLISVGVVVLAAVLVGGLNWWAHGRFVQTTNDAYLHADEVTVAPKVSGYVEQVYVIDNQTVTAGQPLVRIDARTYDASFAQQAANISARQADIVAAQTQVAQQNAVIAQNKAQLSGAVANAAYASSEADRFRTLSAQGVETQDRSAQAQNQKDQTAATVRAQTAAVNAAKRQIATLTAQIGQAKAQLQATQAAAQDAQINVGDTLIRAAISGRIGDKTVRMGQFVQPGTRMMSVVPVQNIYLVANFKETQIGAMRIGQYARIKVDALGGKAIDGTLESFAPGTGAQFALLPPENATGNFTKIVQRVPVRLRISAPAEIRDHLLPGLSATVSIDTAAAPAR
jgi:membrane fusion protein (multidrug efflux system)